MDAVKRLNIILACEESQTVTKLLLAKGHNAWSCDIKSCTGCRPDRHIKGSIFGLTPQGYPVLGKNEYNNFEGWHRLIGHPPCTYLTTTANAWLKDQPKRKSGKLVGQARRDAVEEAKEFFLKLWNCGIEEICLENPVGVMNTIIPPTQIIQPYFFGDSDKKRTCLWLKNLPLLVHLEEDDLFGQKTHVQAPEKSFISQFAGSGINAQAFRSKSFKGISEAIVNQWN